MNPYIKMSGIVKVFPGVIANDHIDLEVEKGEIHSLLGENGSGKSTLMNVLYGLYEAESGEIFVEGQKVTINSPKDALACKIGMVHQEFMLVSNFSIVENIAMGTDSAKKPFLDLETIEKRIIELAEQYNFGIYPREKIKNLCVGEQQRVEILSILFHEVELLIFDEPTAVLTPQETEEFFNIIRTLKEQGKTVIFISHKLNEVMEISDRITVLRKGKAIATLKKQETSKEELANLMVGRTVFLDVDKKDKQSGETVIAVSDIVLESKGKNYGGKPISFNVREGEILGIAGVSGNGQEELVEIITGVRKVDAGKVSFSGESIENKKPRTYLEKGGGYIPENRQTTGLVMDMSVSENLILIQHPNEPFTHKGSLQNDAIEKNAQALIEEYDIRVPHSGIAAKLLSGGNQQKVILAREIGRKPRAMVAVQPTRGLDVGAIEFVHETLLEAREKDCAILLVSTELDEVMSLSDRIGVLYNGEIVDILDAKSATREEIGLMMAGAGCKTKKNNVAVDG